jgi:L-tyrosine C(3)-methyltransferase
MECSSKVKDFDYLLLIAGGHTAFQLMWAGIELKLFDLLNEKEKLGLADISKALKIEHRPARILLTGLTSIHLLQKEGDFYSNSVNAKEWLVSTTEQSIAKVMGWQRHIVYEGELEFVQALKENRNVGLEKFPGEGENLYQRLRSDTFL